MKVKITLLLSAVLFLFTAANAQVRYLTGILQASQEVGTINSPASGVVIVKYDTATNVLQLFGNYRNLTSTITGSHIHGPAGPGVNANVLFNLTNMGGTDGALGTSVVLTDPQEIDLLAGNMYVNVHTVNNTGGEIRAQLTPTVNGQTEFVNARLQGAQSTPPTSSLAMGSVYAIIDKATSTLYLTGSYSGLTSVATNAHIHMGAHNIAGPVIIPLNFTANTSGSLDTSIVLSMTDQNNILNGNTYVNVHSLTYPAGEIRGQLTQLSQMWFFANTLQGSQEVPPNASSAGGTVIVKYNTVTNLLELVGDYQNLSASISASHIHGPAGPGVAAGVLFNVVNTGGITGTLTCTATLTDVQEGYLLAGNLYVNVHSSGLYSNGEIRAQLLPTAMGSTQYLTGSLQVSQSVSAVPITSTGFGSVTALLDRVSNTVYVTGNFRDLSSNITASHIHGGAAGTNGPVVVPLIFAGARTGTITGTAMVSSSFADSMINGFSYINIHTLNYPGGEIRAQLGDLVLPVTLKVFNGYKEKDKIVLVWQSEVETNVGHYEIEQQDVRTLQWISKASVTASNNATGSNYLIRDVPFAGTGSYVYYRLKIVDKDGRYTYSRVVRINNLQAQAELVLVSNPVADGDLRFLITGLSGDKRAEVSIIDFSGKMMAQKTISTLANNSIGVQKLGAGMYKLVVRFDDVVLQKTFMK